MSLEFGDELFDYNSKPEEEIPRLKAVRGLGIKPPLLVDENGELYRVFLNSPFHGIKGIYKVQSGVPKERVSKIEGVIEELKK